MRFPLSLTTSMAGYIAKNKITGKKKFPLVLMLEPLHACNLTCTGCGRIREYAPSIKEKLTVEECLASVDEAGAPIVSICGGEPLIYPEIGDLVSGILQRKKHIYLCTNGVFLEKKLDEFKPTSRFFFNVHLDGLEKTHDIMVEREGVFQKAVAGIKAAKARGHLVCTNTTIYKETNLAEIDELFGFLASIGVDGFMVSPAYGYSAVHDTNPEGAQEIFMTRKDIHEKFSAAQKLFAKHRMISSPIYLDFLAGKRDLSCAAYANPTRNVKGWKGPCYLITDKHHDSFQGLIQETNWDAYGHGKDARCEHCLMHCGFEISAALGVNAKLGDTLRMIAWQVA